MHYLAINDGYAAGAALFENGKPVLMAGEERFCRIKNYSGFPDQTIEWIFSETGLSWQDMKAVGLSTRSATVTPGQPFKTSRHSFFSTAAKILPELLGNDGFIRYGTETMARFRRKKAGSVLMKKTGGRCPKIRIYDHHLCHAAAGFHGSGFADRFEKSLVITYDGSGDGMCCTISIASKKGMQTIFRINSFHSLGLLYTRVTQLLGMKPLEHEYKLMGMAPYAETARAEKAAAVLDKYIRLSPDGLSMKNISRSWGKSMLEKLEKDFRSMRFDWIAAGVQLHFERIMMGFILAWVKKTRIKNLVCSGGSFMNVKLNMLLGQSDEIDNFYVLPSCGDESMALGAGYLVNEEFSPETAGPLTNLYLGTDISNAEIREACEKRKDVLAWEENEDIETKLADLLAGHQIVARCKGRMEWGARALGNRSILANPSRMQAIHRINKAIKMRDFWMPFCPSMLKEEMDTYLENPKNLDASYMIVAFPTKPIAHEHLPAALHPFDLTARPQVVSKEMNPEYHRLIAAFREKTGLGAVLNTSFNLHGDPIVRTAEEAVSTYLNSGLDYLALNNVLIHKK